MKKNHKDINQPQPFLTNQWLLTNYKESIFYKNIQVKEDTLSDIKPSQVFIEKKGKNGGFQKFPHILLEIIYKLPLTINEIKLLIMIIHRCFRWYGGWICCYYKRKEFRKELLMDERVYDKSLKTLQDKNIIQKVKNNETDKQKRITTDYKIVFNIFIDTWKIIFYSGGGKSTRYRVPLNI